jgi:hypothetical protein
MKKLLITSAFIGLSFILSAQTIVKKGEDGNYTFVEKSDSNGVTPNGLFLTDKDGKKLVVYVTRKGKEFVWATSKKTSKPYRKYIATQKYAVSKN